jgi:hypothetical protein
MSLERFRISGFNQARNFWISLQSLIFSAAFHNVVKFQRLSFQLPNELRRTEQKLSYYLEFPHE